MQMKPRVDRIVAAAVVLACGGASVGVVALAVGTSTLNPSNVALAATNHVHATAAAGAGAGPSSSIFAIAPRAAPQRLFIPPLLKPVLEGDTKVFTLKAQSGTILRYGQTLASSGFNGAYLAPTIRVSRGDKVRMEVTNAMPAETTVHWHGLHVPASADGGPYQPIAAGGTWKPSFDIAQEAATLWYHPHLMGLTAQQVGRGMAGMLIIDEPTSTQQTLPHTYGVDDIPVILQGAPLPLLGGNSGPRPLMANGTPNARHRSRATRMRLRLVNSTGGAILGVSIPGATSVRMIGSDGGLLPTPANGRRLILGPSERSELLVDMAPGSRARVRVTILPDLGSDAVRAQTAFLAGRANARETGTVLTLINTATRKQSLPTIPKLLNVAPKLDLGGAVKREMILGPGIELNGDLMSEEDHADGADMEGTLRIPLNQTELWTISNRGILTHVFHVHDIQFQVVSRSGRAPAAQERGWKDSIHLAPGQTAQIAMKFTTFADPNSPYMFHCHILRHEDGGMMGQFVVVP